MYLASPSLAVVEVFFGRLQTRGGGRSALEALRSQRPGCWLAREYRVVYNWLSLISKVTSSADARAAAGAAYRAAYGAASAFGGVVGW